jgi:membrane-associated protease RseP (regulator of RpoE activity)
MEDRSASSETSAIVTAIPRFDGMVAPQADASSPARHPLRIPKLNQLLFLLTLLTTTMTGADISGAEVSVFHPLTTLMNLPAGLSFSIPLVGILLAHEMGHFFASRRHGVDATLPFFIPGPYSLFPMPGTFGAFIRMRSLPRSRGAMFDIGAAGPWAGFIVAVVAVIVGLHWSQVGPLDSSAGGWEFGNSIIFWTLSRVVLGVDPDTVMIGLHPAALAGWFGIFVTALNLLPVGQLDGGHVVYALLGPRSHRVISRLAWLSCLFLGVVPRLLGVAYWPGWLMWFVLVLALGLGHPSTRDIDSPLRGGRRLAAWATVLVFIVTFSPVPVSFTAPKVGLPPQNEGPSYSVLYRVPAATSGHVVHTAFWFSPTQHLVAAQKSSTSKPFVRCCH